MSARLIVLLDGSPPETVPIEAGKKLVIGREETADIVIANDTVSTEHAEVELDGNQLLIRDLDSTNHTFYNGEQITKATIAGGQRFVAGEVDIRFETDEEEEALDIETQIEQLQAVRTQLRTEFAKVIVGQEAVLNELLVTVFAGGHALLEGVPGLAKTLIISTLSRMLSLNFKRIQFTPDLMPSDITGTNVIEEDHTTGKRVTVFVAGPVFTNIVLADEINRTPPKTQAALLQAMQEHEVSAGGKSYELVAPFFVMATQNPIDQEGTYPLPEAQKDRVLMNILIGYPDRDEEEGIVEHTTTNESVEIDSICDGSALIRFQRLIRDIPVSKHVTGYAVDLVRATRPTEADALEFVKEQVSWGAGPRASQALILCAKCQVALDGRLNVSTDDVRRVALPVMRHRILCSFRAEAEGITTDDVVSRLIKEIPERATK
ncbi:MAG: AAA family ATPase [Lentisphaeria bacterium]|nr:AAA family ATPase [Lentisphaeria bacterium]